MTLPSFLSHSLRRSSQMEMLLTTLAHLNWRFSRPQSGLSLQYKQVPTLECTYSFPSKCAKQMNAAAALSTSRLRSMIQVSPVGRNSRTTRTEKKNHDMYLNCQRQSKWSNFPFRASAKEDENLNTCHGRKEENLNTCHGRLSPVNGLQRPKCYLVGIALWYICKYISTCILPFPI